MLVELMLVEDLVHVHYSCKMTGKSLTEISKLEKERILKQTLRFPLENYSVTQLHRPLHLRSFTLNKLI
jgi:hypothetical protein